MPSRRLLSLRWLGFHLLCLVAVVAMVNLSLWQWNRLHERREFNELVEERRSADVVLLDDLVPPGSDADDAAAAEWRPAQASGVYREDVSFLVVNRSQGGTAGANLVTPLELPDGRLLLVNRGFLPLDQSPPPAPEGQVTVAGIVRDSEERRFGQLTTSGTADSGLPETLRIDIAAARAELGDDVVPAYLEARVSVPADSPALAAVAAPELGEGSHLSYAVQWLIFSACVVVGWVFAVRRSLRSGAPVSDGPALT